MQTNKPIPIQFYEENFKPGDDVLDIASSWVSHYPKEDVWKGGRVVGLGMNEYELSQNQQLTEYKVKDLNEDPVLPFDDASFDKITIVVSIDYLNKVSLLACSLTHSLPRSFDHNLPSSNSVLHILIYLPFLPA